MKTIRHILKKDFRRLRLYVALMAAAVICAYTTNLLYAMLTTPQDTYIVLNSAGRLLTFADLHPWLAKHVQPHLDVLEGISFATWFVLMYFLIIACVFDDPPLGEKTFWRSRPISGSQMFGAKLLFVFLITVPLPSVTMALTSTLLYPAWDTPYFFHVLFLTSGLMVIAGSTILVSTTLWKNPVIGFGCILLFYFFQIFYLDRIPPSAWYLLFYGWPVLALAIAASVYICHRQRTGFMLLASGFVVYSGVCLLA